VNDYSAIDFTIAMVTIDVVLETEVLVSRCLDDRNGSLGLGQLVLVLR